MLNVGAMRHQIIIEKVTETRTGTGGVTQTWGTFAEPWAERVEQPGREFQAADQKVAEAKRLYRIRWRTDLTRKMRINDEGDIWDIHSINEIEHRTGLEIQATADRVS